jgi:hypothetical protein
MPLLPNEEAKQQQAERKRQDNSDVGQAEFRRRDETKTHAGQAEQRQPGAGPIEPAAGLSTPAFRNVIDDDPERRHPKNRI